MNREFFPLVSVLMPAYNREAFIGEAVDAVLASTFSNFELIIVDDHSTDRTWEIVQEYALQDSRVRVFRNEKNLDQFPNRNRAASFAKGEIIFCADSDDTIEPDALEYVVKHFDAHPSANFATMYLLGDIDKPTVVDSKTAIRRNFLQKEFLVIGPAGTIVRTAFFKKIGWFSEAYGPAGDMVYNIKAACNTDILLLPYVFFKYRRHAGQEINKKYSYLYNNYRYLKDVMAFPGIPLSDEERKLLLLKNNRNFLEQAFMHIKSTGEWRAVWRARKLAGFGWKELLSGIFNKSF